MDDPSLVILCLVSFPFEADGEITFSALLGDLTLAKADTVRIKQVETKGLIGAAERITENCLKIPHTFIISCNLVLQFIKIFSHQML